MKYATPARQSTNSGMALGSGMETGEPGQPRTQAAGVALAMAPTDKARKPKNLDMPKSYAKRECVARGGPTVVVLNRAIQY